MFAADALFTLPTPDITTMLTSALRCAGSAAIAFLLTGCATHSPFDVDELDATSSAAESARAVRVSSADLRAAHHDEDAAAVAVDGATSLDELLVIAAERHPGVAAAYQAWSAALARVPQHAALPDPRLTLGAYLNEVETRVGPMRGMVTISQTVPWPGTLDDRERAAQQRADAAAARLDAALLALQSRVTTAVSAVVELETTIDLTRDMLDLAAQSEQIAESRYRIAAVNHPDLARGALERLALADRVAQLEAMRAPARARLNAELNRPADAPLPFVPVVDARVTTLTWAELVRALEAHNPELTALLHDVHAAQTDAQLAAIADRPDLTVGVSYTSVGARSGVDLDENGDDPILATLSVTLPVWREKYDGVRREALANRLAAAHRLEARRSVLQAELRQTLFEHHDAQRRIALYDDALIPQAVAALEDSFSRFERDEMTFLDLIDLQRTLLEYRLARTRALTERSTSYARLEALVGRRLDRLTDDHPDGGES